MNYNNFAEDSNSRSGSIHFMTLFNRQGKTRLAKWYKPFKSKEKTRMLREMNNLILSRRTAMCNVLEWKGMKLVRLLTHSPATRYGTLPTPSCTPNTPRPHS